MLLFLPMLLFWLISVFVPRIIDIFYPNHINSEIFDIWQVNVFIIELAAISFIVLAFKEFFMGLKLISQNYNWNASGSIMDIINSNAEYASHFLKSQTVNMSMSIYLIKAHYTSLGAGKGADGCTEGNNGDVCEYLDILSRSVSSLESYFDRIKYHSQVIKLQEEGLHRLTDILSDAMLISLNGYSQISIHIDIDENIFFMCDKVHMTEVFVNIITNAAEAMNKNGAIEISEKKDRSKYKLLFKDNGNGIDKDMLKNIFVPRVSSKSKDKNSGLGLSYCKNVMIEHNGDITAKSTKGEGTTIIITFPSKRVRVILKNENIIP
jgi:signal transduction histidine kinase